MFFDWTKKCRWYSDLVAFNNKIDLFTTKIHMSSENHQQLNGKRFVERIHGHHHNALLTTELCYVSARFLPISFTHVFFISSHLSSWKYASFARMNKLLAWRKFIYAFFARSRETIITICWRKFQTYHKFWNVSECRHDADAIVCHMIGCLALISINIL